MERVQTMIEKTKQMVRERKAKSRAMKPQGLFRRAYDAISWVIAPGRVLGSSGARIDIPPPPQAHTGKQ